MHLFLQLALRPNALRESPPRPPSTQGMAFERYDILRWYESEDTVFMLVDIKARVHGTGWSASASSCKIFVGSK